MLRLLCCAAVAITATGATAAETFCGEAFTSHEALEAAIKAKPGIKVIASDASVVSYSETGKSIIWNFSTKASPAFPTVVCRRLVEKSGSFNLATDIKCGASQEACNRLAASYRELDNQMKQSLDQKKK